MPLVIIAAAQKIAAANKCQLHFCDIDLYI